MKPQHPVLAAALLLAAAPLAAQAPARLDPRPTTPAITAADAMTRVYTLADDSMGGREAGRRGNFMATEYIAREAQRMGLQPAGENGTFFQVVPIVRKALAPDAGLTVDGTPLRPFVDFAPVPFVSGFLAVGDSMAVTGSAAVYGGVWGSEGALAPDQTRGKVVVYSAPPGQLGWRFWNNVPLDRFAGAAGILIATLDASPPAMVDFIRTEQEGLRQARPAGLPPVMLITAAVAERIVGVPLAGAATGAAGRPVSGGFRFVEQPTEFPARNVVAVLPGSDPALRGQYVAIGAHNDHVGTGSPLDHDSVRVANRLFRPMGLDGEMPELSADQVLRLRSARQAEARERPTRMDSIFNGADDDASGTTGVLEIAEHFAAQPRAPRRSLLFVWHTAEEKGLLGSEHFTDHPTVQRDSVVAQLNIDMIGRGVAGDQAGLTAAGATVPGGPRYVQLVGSRRLSRELGDLVEEVNREAGHGMQLDYAIDANGHPAQIYCRSDHYNYARYGIPVTFFTTGMHAEYHQVTDEPQYVDYEKLTAVSRLIGDIAAALANRDARPALNGPRPDPSAQCRQ